MNELFYQSPPVVTIGTNKFIDVPIILKYEDLDLIQIVKEQTLGFTTEIPIFHSDGTYLAKVNGTRIYPTEAGKKAGLVLDKRSLQTILTLDGKTLFEINHTSGDSFKMTAELFTDTGVFIKYSDSPIPEIVNIDGEGININSNVFSNNTFKGCHIGIHMFANGDLHVGVF